jgi:hypothetical protein
MSASSVLEKRIRSVSVYRSFVPKNDCKIFSFSSPILFGYVHWVHKKESFIMKCLKIISIITLAISILGTAACSEKEAECTALSGPFEAGRKKFEAVKEPKATDYKAMSSYSKSLSGIADSTAGDLNKVKVTTEELKKTPR